jgi:hypothetical protein
MMGAVSYESQVSRIFKSHIISKKLTEENSKVEVIISIDSSRIIDSIKLIQSTGDVQWKNDVLNSIKFISSKYQFRSTMGYGVPGVLNITFKP